MDKNQKNIGNLWSKNYNAKSNRCDWWEHRFIVRHINRLVCGRHLDGTSQGLNYILKTKMKHMLPFERGISVGCGLGTKEAALIKQGIVKTFELYELSEYAIKEGKKYAKQEGVFEQIKFIHGDAFKLVPEKEQYDFVHWNNSLHHMFDVHQALKWTREILKTGKLLYLDDFVGPSRFQWTDKELHIATRIRKIFSNTGYLQHHADPGALAITKIQRISEEILMAHDPSEAADSSRIVEALYKYFPNANFIPTGGAIYHLSLSAILHNFDETQDKILLELLMMIDELCAKLGYNYYGAALVLKEP